MRTMTVIDRPPWLCVERWRSVTSTTCGMFIVDPNDGGNDTMLAMTVTIMQVILGCR